MNVFTAILFLIPLTIGIYNLMDWWDCRIEQKNEIKAIRAYWQEREQIHD